MAVKKKYDTGARRTALGKGLDALISTEDVRTEGSSTISAVPLEQIEANPNQPRRAFGEETLAELAASIEQIGIIQPITLHQLSKERYMIIAGERRWRAAQMLGLPSIPAYIRTLSDGNVVQAGAEQSEANIMEMALIENIQREDLNVIEVALAYQHLMEQDGMTQEKLAKRVGKGRTVITNTLRLLRLPAEVQMALQQREIDMGHARALLAIESPSEQVRVFREIVQKGFSVRQVEQMVQALKKGVKEKVYKRIPPSMPEKYGEARKVLSSLMSSDVQIKRAKSGKGTITIAFSSDEAFDSLVEKLTKLISSP